MADVLKERARMWLMKVNHMTAEQLDKALLHGELDSLTNEFAVVREAALGERNAAMKALAHHDGRDWCAVCGLKNKECNVKTPGCLGARARREYPRKTT